MIEEMLTIHPRSPDWWGSCCSICVIACLQPRKTDRELMRIVSSQTLSSVKCSTAGVFASKDTPALFTMLRQSSANNPREYEIDLHIQPSESPYCLVHQFLHALCIADVYLVEFCLSTSFLDQLMSGRLLLCRSGRWFQVRAQYLCTFSSVSQGNRAAESGRGSRDDSDFIEKTAGKRRHDEN